MPRPRTTTKSTTRSATASTTAKQIPRSLRTTGRLPESLRAVVGVPDLIRALKGDPRKGGSTYRDLADRRPVDPETGEPQGPGEDRLAQMVQYDLNEYPSPEKMRGMAAMLGVHQQVIIDVCSVSCGMELSPERQRTVLEILLSDTEGVDALTPESIHAILNVVNERIGIDRIAELTKQTRQARADAKRTKPAAKAAAAARQSDGRTSSTTR